MKSIELEQKYRIASPAVFRRKLRTLGARQIRSGFETNALFDLNGILRSRAGILRLRRHGKEKTGLLTFKGPRLKGRYKKRKEIETPVNGAAAAALLKALGFRKVAGYSKKREEYSLGRAHVTLDHLSGNGWFLEIEAAKGAEIGRLEKKLGLSAQHREERTYLEILNPSFRSPVGGEKSSIFKTEISPCKRRSSK